MESGAVLFRGLKAAVTDNLGFSRLCQGLGPSFDYTAGFATRLVEATNFPDSAMRLVYTTHFPDSAPKLVDLTLGVVTK